MVYEIDVKTNSRVEFKDIASDIESIVEKSKIKNGICFVFVPHTTAGITINENADQAVRKDIINQLNKLVPFGGNYSHSEGNSDAHVKASLVGSSLSLIVEEGRLVLGTWQGIYFCEFDGPRQRKVLIKIL